MKKLFKLSIGFFLAINLLYVASVVVFGNYRKLPAAYKGFGEAVVQGFNCGWDSNVSNVWTCK